MKTPDWTTELRYRPYKMWDTDYLEALKTSVRHSPWRLDFHIQPASGLLNDPNGFSYFNGQWHLFYQAYPFGAVHGLKSWFHLTSNNLVDWQEEGIKLEPTTQHDSHGVYSGTALPIGNELLLAYTGNVRTHNWERLSFQMGAIMDKNNHVTKIEKPLILKQPPGYTDHFRDPQVIPYEGGYLLLIGAQTDQQEGKVLIYQGKTPTKWHLLGELDYGNDDAGFMVECPNLVFIDQQPVLIACPQGMPTDVLPYQNIYPNTFVVGEAFDLTSLSFKEPQPSANLDEGFDLYASQVINAPDGRVLSVGWAGLPELAYPTDAENWAHCLSLVKELSLKNNRLYQQPIAELKELRQAHTPLEGGLGSLAPLVETNATNAYEITLELSNTSKGGLHLYADAENKHPFSLYFDAINGKITLDRSRVSLPINEQFGTFREIVIEKNQPLSLQIFVDQSICEIFVNDGRHVFTSRVFPQAGQTHLFIEGESGNFSGNHWKLRSS